MSTSILHLHSPQKKWEVAVVLRTLCQISSHLSVTSFVEKVASDNRFVQHSKRQK